MFFKKKNKPKLKIYKIIYRRITYSNEGPFSDLISAYDYHQALNLFRMEHDDDVYISIEQIVLYKDFPEEEREIVKREEL